MFKLVFGEVRAALVMLVLLTIVTGVLYPLAVTVAARALPRQAEGSFIETDGKSVGSDLIGQPFDDPKYFWGRPSATSPSPNKADASGGSNLGPTNQALFDAVRDRAKALRDADPGNDAAIPTDLVTASGSGLDPHISPAAADYQVKRIVKARNLSAEKVRELIAANTEGRQFGLLGEACVNVLKLNLALDAAK